MGSSIDLTAVRKAEMKIFLLRWINELLLRKKLFYGRAE